MKKKLISIVAIILAMFTIGTSAFAEDSSDPNPPEDTTLYTSPSSMDDPTLTPASPLYDSTSSSYHWALDSYDYAYATSGEVGNWTEQKLDIHYINSPALRIKVGNSSVYKSASGITPMFEVDLREDDGIFGSSLVHRWYLKPSKYAQNLDVLNAGNWIDGANRMAEFYLVVTINYQTANNKLELDYYTGANGAY